MLDPHNLRRALESKREEFRQYQQRTQRERDLYQEQLETFARAPLEEIQTKLALEPWPGAWPTEEYRQHGGLSVAFSQQFSHHHDARTWARQILEERTTFAVDGSQLMPNKELSIPVAVVQVGWFLNPHSSSRPFEKRIQTEVLGPEELLSSGSEEKLFHDQHISLKRYQLEVQWLQQFCHDHKAQTPLSVGFFDGSLLVSFAEVLKDFHREAYLSAAIGLLRASALHRVPVLGYVDTSVARDVLRMLALFFYQDPPASYEGLRDLDMLAPLLPHWGDRTIAFRLARPGILREYGEDSQEIGFCYLRTSMQKPPVRVEFPLWLHEQGLLEQVMDVLRAEVIVGNGYPYALETADQVAWFAPQDRARFARLLQQFLTDQAIPLQFSNKLQSKQRRRGSL